MKFNTIRNKLIVQIIVPLILVYAVVATIQTRRDIRLSQESANRVLRCTTELHAARCDLALVITSSVAREISNYISIRKPETEEQIVEFLRASLSRHTFLMGGTVAYGPYGFSPEKEFFAPCVYREHTGSELRYKDIAGEYDYTNREWFERPKTSLLPSWSDPYFSKEEGEEEEGEERQLLCSYSAPIFIEGKFVGVATIDLSVENIRQLITMIAPDGIQYWLFGSDGKIISSPESIREEKNPPKSSSVKALRAFQSHSIQGFKDEMRKAQSDTIVVKSPLDGSKIRLVHAPLQLAGWSLWAAIPEDQILQPIILQLEISSLIFLLGLLLIIWIILVVSRRITYPLEKLTVFSQELAAGNLAAQVRGVRGSDEIGQLARAFDIMVVDLKSSVEHRIEEESARKSVEREIEVARKIQTSLLPHEFPPYPERKEFDLYALNRPAKLMAGDFYDFFFTDKSTLAFTIADVSGKGVPAAMFMAVARTAIRNFTIPERSPEEIISKLNHHLYVENTSSMFITLFYGQYDTKSGKLTYVNAGHNPPMIFSSESGTYTRLESTGPLVAAFDESEFEQDSIVLAINDLFFSFTDGVSESYADSPSELYGDDRIISTLRKHREESSERICESVLGDVMRFSRNIQRDDITLLALRHLESSE